MTTVAPSVFGHLKSAGNLVAHNAQNAWKAASNRVQAEGLFKAVGNTAKEHKLATAVTVGTVAAVAVARHRHRARVEQQGQQQDLGVGR